jgi:bifunctional UDP-N-acetylglucosamine pyrophosphorylase/glucosamine-1-phosphate N-acetyltransferase
MMSHNKDYNKVLYPILGKPVVKYVIDSVKDLEPHEIVVVAGCGYENTAKRVENDAKIVKQEEILGTGHAVLQALPAGRRKAGVTDNFSERGCLPWNAVIPLPVACWR